MIRTLQLLGSILLIAPALGGAWAMSAMRATLIERMAPWAPSFAGVRVQDGGWIVSIDTPGASLAHAGLALRADRLDLRLEGPTTVRIHAHRARLAWARSPVGPIEVVSPRIGVVHRHARWSLSAAGTWSEDGQPAARWTAHGDWASSERPRVVIRGVGGPLFSLRRAGLHLEGAQALVAGTSIRVPRVRIRANRRGIAAEGTLDGVEVTRRGEALVVRISGGDLLVTRGPSNPSRPGGSATSTLVEVEVQKVRVRAPAGARHALDLRLSGRVDPRNIDIIARTAAGQLHLWAPRGPGAPQLLSARARGLDPAIVLAALDLPPVAAGRLDGDLTLLRLDGAPHTWLADLDGRFSGAVTHRRLDAAPIEEIDLHARGQANHSAERTDLELRLTSKALNVDLEAGWRPSERHLEVVGHGTPVDCLTAWRSLPRSLRGLVADARLEGRFAPNLRLSVPLDDAFALRFDLTGHDACRVTHLGIPPSAWPPARSAGPRDDVAWLLEPFDRPVPEARAGIRVGPTALGFVRIGALPAYVPAAAIVSEDPGFARGRGISLGLIRRALKFDIDRRGFVYGGSTIPQQLAKNLFLNRSKTLARKLREALIASRLAHAVPPRRLLELYLNCIEFAPNVYGIGRAARYYFQKSASALTPKEAAFLAIAKPQPKYTNLMRAQGRTPDTPHFREYMRRILHRAVQRGALTPAQMAAARPFRLAWRKGRAIDVDSKVD